MDYLSLLNQWRQPAMTGGLLGQPYDPRAAVQPLLQTARAAQAPDIPPMPMDQPMAPRPDRPLLSVDGRGWGQAMDRQAPGVPNRDFRADFGNLMHGLLGDMGGLFGRDPFGREARTLSAGARQGHGTFGDVGMGRRFADHGGRGPSGGRGPGSGNPGGASHAGRAGF